VAHHHSNVDFFGGTGGLSVSLANQTLTFQMVADKILVKKKQETHITFHQKLTFNFIF
jgi:hypothetical protein